MPSINKPKGDKGKPKRPYQKGAYIEPRYNTTRWRRVREQVLQGNPLCVNCERLGLLTVAQRLQIIHCPELAT